MRASLSTRGFERQIGRWTKLLVSLLLIWVQQAHSQTAHAPLTSNLTLTTDILAQRISFESVDDLQGVSGPVALSSRHFKDGGQSLMWRWSTPEPVVFRDLPGLEDATGEYPGGQPEQLEPSYVPPSKQGGLKLWVYRESPNPDGRLVFQVGVNADSAQKRPAYRFEMSQDFSGWRALWVHFEQDAKVEKYAGTAPLRTLRIEPSANMAEDRVYLDMLQLVTYMSRKRHSDLQFVNRKDPSRVDHYRVLPAWQLLDQFADVDFEGDGLDDAYRDLARIEDRYERLLLASGGADKGSGTQAESFAKYLNRQVETAIREFEALGIERSAYGVTGMPLFASRDEHPAGVAKTYQEAGEKILAPLALDYGRSPSDEKKQRVLSLLEHMADQGWAAGSAIGTVNHLIRLNPYANAVFLLRDELRQTSRFARPSASDRLVHAVRRSHGTRPVRRREH